MNYLTLFCFQKCTFDLEQFRLFTILSFCNLQVAICIFSNSQKCALHVFKITSQIWNLTFTDVKLRFDTSKTESTDFIRSVFWSSVGLLAFLVLNSLRLHILQGTYIHNVFLKSKYRFYTCVSLVPLLSFTHLLVQGDHRPVNANAVRKSVGAESTYFDDKRSAAELHDALEEIINVVPGATAL